MDFKLSGGPYEKAKPPPKVPLLKPHKRLTRSCVLCLCFFVLYEGVPSSRETRIVAKPQRSNHRRHFADLVILALLCNVSDKRPSCSITWGFFFFWQNRKAGLSLWFLKKADPVSPEQHERQILTQTRISAPPQHARWNWNEIQKYYLDLIWKCFCGYENK